jgi:ribose-phosphate pyrophosphokinase
VRKTFVYTVIGGPASAILARKIARLVHAKYIQAQVRMFADGESKITIPQKPKGKTIIVNSTHPPTDTNLVQTFSLIAQAKRYASEVIAIIPYLAYLRQDIEFLQGEIVTSAVVARSLSACGASKIITVDAHSQIALGYFDVPVANVSAIPKLAQYFKKLKLDNPLVVAPDLFWSDKAYKFAEILSTDSIALNKQRDRKTGKLHIIQSKKMNLQNRDIILVDDMISTGNSIIKAAQYLRKQNCGRLFACCTHGLLVDNAQKRIKSAGIQKLVCTNTIPGKNAIIDVSDVLVSSLSF